MSIGQRVSDTIQKLQESNPESALHQICAAIEATVKRESGAGGRSNYKNFIQQNMELITRIAFNSISGKNMYFELAHPDLPKDSNGVSSIQDIFYHVVRCGLYHDAKLPDNLRFCDGKKIFTDTDGVLVLPSELIDGLLIAVVTSSVNSKERALGDYVLTFPYANIAVNSLWGRRNELIWLLDAIAETRRIAE
ncbi:hypothetical protein ACFL1X_10995 [Candidatus Hydrogenedentota bacterium]